MTLKLKIVKSGCGFLHGDIGKYVEIVDVVDCGLDEYEVLVKPLEGVDYSTLKYTPPFGYDNRVSSTSFGCTAEQIKKALEKEKQKEDPVKEFYKTIKVGDIVLVQGKGHKEVRYDAIVKVKAIYDRFAQDDYGFDAELLSGFVGRGTRIGEETTIGDSSLRSGDVVVSPVENKQRCVAQDMVNSPNHYILFEGVEVKDVVKEVLRRWQDESDVDMSFNQAGMMKEALQYLLRAPKKNKKEDVEKAVYYLKGILEEWNE